MESPNILGRKMSLDRERLYQVLGLEKGASPDEIKRAYRKLASRYHPAKNPDNQQAAKKFKEIKNAKATLCNAHKRKVYDKYGSYGLFMTEHLRKIGIECDVGSMCCLTILFCCCNIFTCCYCCFCCCCCCSLCDKEDNPDIDHDDLEAVCSDQEADENTAIVIQPQETNGTSSHGKTNMELSSAD